MKENFNVFSITLADSTHISIILYSNFSIILKNFRKSIYLINKLVFLIFINIIS